MIERAGQSCAIGSALFERIHQPYNDQEDHRGGALRFGANPSFAEAIQNAPEIGTGSDATEAETAAADQQAMGAYYPQTAFYTIPNLEKLGCDWLRRDDRITALVGGLSAIRWAVHPSRRATRWIAVDETALVVHCAIRLSSRPPARAAKHASWLGRSNAVRPRSRRDVRRRSSRRPRG